MSTTTFTALGHWRGRRFVQRGVWHALRIKVDGIPRACVRAMNEGGGALDVAPDTLARIKAGLPTDVPKGRFCKRCLARLEASTTEDKP